MNQTELSFPRETKPTALDLLKECAARSGWHVVVRWNGEEWLALGGPRGGVIVAYGKTQEEALANLILALT